MAIDTRVVKNVVDGQLHQIRTLSDLAQLLGCSPEALRKEFTRREGISLSKYVLEVRVERTKHLLEESNKECKEICFDVGFSRSDDGTRTFKRLTGLSMGEFRRVSKRH